MRDLNTLNHARDSETELRCYGVNGDDSNGVFRFRSPVDPDIPMRVIASVGGGWDHVSVSAYGRVPNYEEMEWVAKTFFRDDEAAVQYHVPESDHVNCHPFCLHWWRPTQETLPRPPTHMVGPKT